MNKTVQLSAATGLVHKLHNIMKNKCIKSSIPQVDSRR